MKFNFFNFIYAAIFLLSSSVEANASDYMAGALEKCKVSLEKASSSSRKTLGISTYRLLNDYPPLGGEKILIEQALGEVMRRVKKISIASECFYEDFIKSNMKYSLGGLEKISKNDLIPIRILDIENGYLMVFIYPGYIEKEGTGFELVTGLAVFNKSGGLLRVFERAASWANNEGTLILRESCVKSGLLSISDRWVYPDKVLDDGTVVSYASVYEVSQETQSIFDEKISSKDGYECPDESYISIDEDS